jgi:uncharacterized protein YndB with AHSA1/START domain
MSAVTKAAPETGIVVDQNALTIVLVRHFNVPRGDVFDAWTKPERMSAWWDPAGKPLAVCDIDLRVGGAFRFVTLGHPEMPFAGIYVEIVRPDRLVFESNGATGRVIFTESSGRTHMTVTIECASKEQFELYLKVGVDVDTGVTLNNLVRYIEARR